MTTPPRTVTAAEKADYLRDGVVCLRAALDPGIAVALASHWDAAVAAADPSDRPAAQRVSFSRSPFIKHVSQYLPLLRRTLLESQIAGLVGGLTGASSVGFFWDQMFEKPVDSATATPWHHDAAGWPLRGEQIVGAWVALTPTTPANGLECLAGSHRFPHLYWAETAPGRLLTPPPDRPHCPDFEQRRGDPSLRFLGWDMQPGDALFIHPRTLHFSTGNRTRQRRLAYATWWYGDDIVWDPRPECEDPAPGVDRSTMRRGERPSGDPIPVVWRAPARAPVPASLRPFIS